MPKKVFCLIIAALLFVSGCGSKDINEKYLNEDFSYDNIQLGYDAQPFFELTFSAITSTENGYYYIDKSCRRSKEPSSEMYLMFFDRESGQAAPVCNKADCKHQAEDDCDALFSMMNADNPVSSVYGLWYYDGNLYTVLQERDGSQCLYKISQDGSVRTKYITLFEGGISSGYKMYYHRGYIYIAMYSENKALLYRVKIEKDAKLELVLELEDSDYEIWFGEFAPYKKGIAVATYFYSDSEDKISGADVLYYNPETKKTGRIIEKANFDSYFIMDSKFYYTQDGDIYVRDIDSGDEYLFYSCDHSVYISYDGNYLYAETCPVSLEDYSEHYIYVLDLEGKLVDTIQAPSTQDCYFGDKDYLFQMFDLNEDLTDKSDMAVIKAFDKSQIGTGSYEWIELELPVSK